MTCCRRITITAIHDIAGHPKRLNIALISYLLIFMAMHPLLYASIYASL